MSHFKRPAGLKRTGNPWYFLFWPIFALRYLLIENCHPASVYHQVYCTLDDRVPFLEVFILPYVFWYVCIVGMHFWLFFRDEMVFRSYSRYLIFAMSISTTVFLLYPTCQNLRPTEFQRENALTNLAGLLYRMDTNTNVCPSEHIIGSAGFFLAAIHSKKLQQKSRIVPIGIAAFLTGIATVFLKQHSVLDILAAIPVCAAAYIAAYHPAIFQKLHLICRIKNRFRAGRFSV